jgi:hypothetical protein
LLALVNPLAALIPLVELGDAAPDKSGSDGCAGLVVPAALNEAPPGQVAAKRPTPG